MLKGFGMTLFLGIDGGGTGCRAAVADASGRILGHGAAGPANIASDLAMAGRNILSAAEQALAIAVGPGAVASELPRLHAGLGLAGANTADASDRLRQALPFARIRVETDAVTAVKGALRGGDGVVAALGTGSVFASQRGGVIRQIGGWGLALGDEGSGAWLGRAILRHALRAVDGFVPMTPLVADLIAEHGSPAAIVRFAQTARPAEFAELAPRLFASDDPAAVAVVSQATADVAGAIDHLLAKAPVPVVFIGGLGPVYAERLAGRWDTRSAFGTALDGALILAREAA
jgi:glucosamine kinase